MGRPKSLVSVGGERMLERTLRNLREGGIADIVVVLGHHAAEVRRSIDLRETEVVENPDYAEGMASSLRRGVRTAAGRADHVMIVLADQPFVRPETIRHLARHATEGVGTIFVPTYKGVWGNPVVFAASLAGEVERIHGDIGCRAMFPNHTDEIREVPVDDPGTLVDLDTEEEVGALESALAAGQSVPELLDRLSEPRWSLHASPEAHPMPRSLYRQPDVLARAEALRRQGVPFVLATVVRIVRPTSGRPGYRAIVREDGSHVGWVGGACTEHLLISEARAALQAGAPRLLRVTPDPAAFPDEEGVVNHAMSCQSGGTVEIFLEPHRPKPTLLVVGDSPVATSLSALGPLLGFRVVLVAPGVDPSEVPEVDELVVDLDEVMPNLSPTTYAVVASMGKYDESALAQIARAPVAFAGLVASRKRAESVFASLREDGVSDEQIARVRNPVGVDIAATTPEEIAVSIVAEITRVRRTATVAAPAAPRASTEAIDPVCGMTVETTTPLVATEAGTTYYFCAESCRRSFRKDPARYLGASRP